MRTIIVEPYNLAWSDEFEKIREYIWQRVNDIALEIIHVGSTSVPGLAAKPIIDFNIIIESYDLFPQMLERLQELGYEHDGDGGIPKRERIKGGKREGFMDYHMYVCPKDSLVLYAQILFRDYLRQHENARNDYAALKNSLAEKHKHDIEAYVSGKHEFVMGIVDSARKEIAMKNAEYYTKQGEPWLVYTAALGELKKYRYTVIFARYDSGWLYCRHKDRDTYETPGGEIESGESVLECAKRELHEETGATNFFIHPAFDYAVHTETRFAYGQVFYADIKTLGEIPNNSEMMEVRNFHTIPDKMTYPAILPVLFKELRKWLGLEKSELEYWDILDENREHTGRKHKRGDKL
jgi:GrpB-like predicted nucleotidyltransferase (UPF0157 family)/ADP-ribose pyrophosphatase YjhB (NUDIX family)